MELLGLLPAALESPTRVAVALFVTTRCVTRVCGQSVIVEKCEVGVVVRLISTALVCLSMLPLGTPAAMQHALPFHMLVSCITRFRMSSKAEVVHTPCDTCTRPVIVALCLTNRTGNCLLERNLLTWCCTLWRCCFSACTCPLTHCRVLRNVAAGRYQQLSFATAH